MWEVQSTILSNTFGKAQLPGTSQKTCHLRIMIQELSGEKILLLFVSAIRVPVNELLTVLLFCLPLYLFHETTNR